jgi:iron complex transport system permease protein
VNAPVSEATAPVHDTAPRLPGPGEPVPTGRLSLRLPLGGGASLRVDARSAAVTAIAALLALVLAVLSLGWGDIVIPLRDVLASFTGEAGRKATLVVQEWRLGRAELALLFGAALGASGALFQSLTRNPLGSPDVIGFSSGAYTGALLLMLFTAASPLVLAAGSLVSGVIVALLVLALSARDGTTGFRLIVIGIGVGAVLASVNAYLLLVADQRLAMSAAVWGAGSLNSVAKAVVLPSAVAIGVFLVAALALQGRARVMEQGEDFACSLGVATRTTRYAVLVVGVGLVAVVTAAAGPIAFVALVAPQIAGRLTRRGELDIVPAAAIGALLLVASDVVARLAFAPLQLPVGIVTVCLGGAYLLVLLVKEARA